MVEQHLADLNGKTARIIIDRLKDGTTPFEDAIYLDVGRDRWYRGMGYYFDVAQDGASKVRFISARYGGGKTHLLSMARHIALERNFVVSYVSAEHAPLNKLEEVYKQVLKNLETRDPLNGIRFILHKWQGDVGRDNEAVLSGLRDLPGIDINFRKAVEAYLRDEDPDHQDTIEQWLVGEPVKLKELNINRYLRAGDSREMMRSLSIFLRFIGYSGLLVLFDELDRILNLTSRARQNCYQVLRELMDNTDGQGGMQGTIFYCAIPPAMFADSKGFKEYDALWSRVHPTSMTLEREGSGKPAIDYRSTIIDLELTPLDREEFCEIGYRVRDIHKVARQWDAAPLSDERIRQTVDQIIANRYNPSVPRIVATHIARMAEMEEQGIRFSDREEINNTVDIAEREQARRLRRKLEDDE